MKQRVISGVIIALVTIVSVLFGNILKIVCALIAVQATREVMNLRRTKFDKYLFITMLVSILAITYFEKFGIIVTLIEPIVLCGICVFVSDLRFEDVCLVETMSLMIGMALHYFLAFDALSPYLFGYVIIIAYLTDVFALLTGMKFGKRKLCPRVSPHKTVEGFIGGWICGAVISFVWAACFHFFYMPVSVFIVGSIILPLVSQIGDLIFSMIKRNYDVKDFSNLIPGHGGILDRLDSLIVTTLVLAVIWIVLA